MSTKSKDASGVPSATALRHEREAELGVGGALAGAALGAIAGPPGAAAGAIVGGIVGLVSGVASARGSEIDAAREEQLDNEIGLNGEGLGAPGLEHPPARLGVYSSASSGTGAAAAEEAPPADGPMSAPED